MSDDEARRWLADDLTAMAVTPTMHADIQGLLWSGFDDR